MKVQALFCIAVLALLGTTAQAQDSQESQGLITALEGAKSAVLRGSVEISKSDAEADAMQGGQNIPGLGNVRIQVRGAKSGGKSAFTGNLEVFAADGAISAATASGLPQFKVYNKGDQKLISQIYSKSPKSIGKTTDLLALAFDFDSLIEEIKDATLVRAKDVEGGKQYRVTLDADAFEIEDAAGGIAAQVALSLTKESVLEGVLTVDTDSSGALTKLNLELQYNDPMAGLLKMGGGGGGAMQLNLGNMKKNTDLGPKLNIAFTPNAEQGKAAEAFAKEAAELLSAEGE